MAKILTDEEIAELLQEPKQLTRNWETRLRPRPKSNFKFIQRDCEIKGENGHTFRIILRHNMINPLDFSIILSFQDEDGTEFNLCRYNGKHPSQHTNKLEKSKGLPDSSFRNAFHIHMVTQRYQEEGLNIDGYAEVTNEYSSFDTALRTFVRTNGFSVPGNEPSLFDVQGDPK
ncbi:hypothetical protein ES703_53806 [subsurface metagenome]